MSKDYECAWCGGEFDPAESGDAEFCSEDCRMMCESEEEE